MTQKELLYLEDAIGHESSIIKILEESISKLDDKNLSNFLEDEITVHQNLKSKLLSKMEEKANG